MKEYEYAGIPIRTKEDIFEALNEHCGGDEEAQDGVAVFDDMVSAFIGFANDNRPVYDYNKMVQFHMEENGMTEEEATEHIEFNVLRSIPYMKKAPIILYPADEMKGE